MRTEVFSERWQKLAEMVRYYFNMLTSCLVKDAELVIARDAKSLILALDKNSDHMKTLHKNVRINSIPSLPPATAT